ASAQLPLVGCHHLRVRRTTRPHSPRPTDGPFPAPDVPRPVPSPEFTHDRRTRFFTDPAARVAPEVRPGPRCPHRPRPVGVPLGPSTCAGPARLHLAPPAVSIRGRGFPTVHSPARPTRAVACPQQGTAHTGGPLRPQETAVMLTAPEQTNADPQTTF